MNIILIALLLTVIVVEMWVNSNSNQLIQHLQISHKDAVECNVLLSKNNDELLEVCRDLAKLNKSLLHTLKKPEKET